MDSTSPRHEQRTRHVSRPGRASLPLLMLGGSLVVTIGLTLLLMRKDRGATATSTPTKQGHAAASSEPLVIYCAASNKPVIEKLRTDCERKFGIPVRVEYGPSQTLLSSIEVAKTGDLYLPADDSYLDLARHKQLVESEFPLAVMQARLAVKQGNPLGIERLDDIGAKSARLAQANPEAAAISKLVKERLTETGQWEALAAQTTVFKTTVTEVANDVKVGAVDAGIVWDAMAQQYPDLAFVELPELKAVQSHVALAVLTTSRQPQLAHQVARYLSADDGGLAVYREMGYEAADGDPWEETPELTLYAGSMLRPAIDETIKQFEAREGVRVNRVYNGCGILVAQMKAGQMPDAYFACDAEFMAQVKDLFPQPDSISQNELVILVPKGNPRKIKSLKDLGQEGLRVGIGHEKQCAMGWLTQRTFDEGQVTDVVMKNVAVQSPTGDLLVNQMLAGSLDAAVAYLSNAAGAGDKLDAVRIKGLPCAIATQPYGVSVQSKHKQLAARLKQAILAAESRERFTSQGFGWLAK